VPGGPRLTGAGRGTVRGEKYRMKYRAGLPGHLFTHSENTPEQQVENGVMFG
jgi:hypothetical protein